MPRDYAQVHARRRAAMLKAREIMGGKCTRCGITDPLEWDHINDDGWAVTNRTVSGYRRKPGVSGLYGEFNNIIRTGTSSLLQLLCSNCNQLKKLNRAKFDEAPEYGMLVVVDA